MNINLMTRAPVWGGAECHTVSLARKLQERGHHVRLLTFGPSAYESVSAGVPTQRLPVPSDPKQLWSLRFRDWFRLLREFAPGIGILIKPSFDQGSARLDLAARLVFRRYLTIEHLDAGAMPPRTSRRYWGGLPGLGLWWHQMRWQRRLRSLAPHTVICVSRAVRDRLANEVGFSPGQLQIIRNGVDVNRFVPDPSLRAAQRREWNIPNHALVFGAIGRFCPAKGFEVAVEQFRNLCDTEPGRDFRLVLVGEGPERTTLEEAVRRAGIEDRVFLGGFSAEPWRAHNGFDYFVMPSRTEGLPLALLETMACACPPIAFSVAGIPEVLTRPDLGWLVPPGDNIGFFQALRAAFQLGNGEEWRRMGQQAREHVCAHFNAEIQFGKLCQAIEMVGSGLRADEDCQRSSTTALVEGA